MFRVDINALVIDCETTVNRTVETLVVSIAGASRTRRVTALTHCASGVVIGGLFSADCRTIGREEVLGTLGVAERQQEILRVLTRV